MTAVVVADDVLCRHLRRAIEHYGRLCRADGVRLPAELEQIAPVLACSGPQWSSFDVDGEDSDTAGVKLLLDTEGAARSLSVSETTVRRLAKTGELPAVRIGGAVRFSPADLERFVDEKRGAA